MDILIGALIGLVTGGISGLFWLFNVAAGARANAAEIKRIEAASMLQLAEAKKTFSDQVSEIKAAHQRHEEKVEERFRFNEKRHNELDDRVMDKLSNIERIVAKIEGKLDAQN